MKNNLLKYYITAFYLGSTFMMFADPGGGGEVGDDGSGDSTPTAPIDNYVWFLALVGLVFVFMRYRVAIAKQRAV